MSWFKEHLNLTLFFAWLVANLLFYVGYISAPQDGGRTAQWVTFIVLAGILILGTEIWYLLQKRRSLFYLFLNLLNWIGFIILLSLENKTTPEGSRAFPLSDIYRSSEHIDKPIHTNYDFRYFQEVLSCPTCVYADQEARNQGTPWCNAPQPPDIVKNHCNTWQAVNNLKR